MAAWTAFLGPAVAGIGGTSGSIIQGEYQKKLQEDQQEFAKEQSQNQIKYNIQQMRDMGYSPMMLFEHGNAAGGGAGTGGQGQAPNFANAFIAMSNQIKDILAEDARNDLKERKIDLEEKKEERLYDTSLIDEMYMLDKASYYRSQRQLNNQLFDIRNRKVYNHN